MSLLPFGWKKNNPKKFSTNSHYDTWGTLRVYTLPSSCYRMMGLWSEQRTLHLFVHQIPFFLIYSKTSPQHFSSLLSAFPSLLDHSHQQTNIYKFFIKKIPNLAAIFSFSYCPSLFSPIYRKFSFKKLPIFTLLLFSLLFNAIELNLTTRFTKIALREITSASWVAKFGLNSQFSSYLTSL